ncbi:MULTISPECIES: hypothetical protein [unclassified Mesorhizobium]|uniref:hypothetical protein n=1 Tax=unclassified Mesorhizobium TaxID=325217 RepID=UPI00142EE28A|nr:MULTISPECIES: hypothetical protein [unclassified Mesorhizobium]
MRGAAADWDVGVPETPSIVSALRADPPQGEKESQAHDSAAKLCYAPRFLSGRC